MRVLQEKTYEPLGKRRKASSIMCVSLRRQTKIWMCWFREGEFREDLYYRINVFKIILPPLRERMEDIPLLIDHFIERFNVLQKKSIQGVSEEAMSALMSYSYPGNIRELANIIERAFILCKTGLIEKTLAGVFICDERKS